jgi:hypothetical protein
MTVMCRIEITHWQFSGLRCNGNAALRDRSGF